MRRLGVLAAGMLVAGTLDARAVDYPVEGKKLVLRHSTSGKKKLVFVTSDPSLPFPAIGSADDPSAGTPGGATIELFSPFAGGASITVPAASGWSVRTTAPRTYKFTNKLAPGGGSSVRTLVMKEGKVVRLIGTMTGLSTAHPLSAVGIRVTTGSIRVCARFDTLAVRRDSNGAFIAGRAPATGITDCSNATLGGPTCTDGVDAPICGGTCNAGSTCGTRDLSTCECISSAQPCGDTWPVCNGACPVGDVCGSVGGFPLPSCGCIPAPATPCGNTYPTCGGDCPVGEACYLNSISIPIGTFSWCACSSSPPVDPCGGCPPGFSCAVLPPLGDPFCAPNFCSGGSAYPVCGGTCAPGLTCQAAAVGPGFCVCSP